jgi:hypothetical protein
MGKYRSLEKDERAALVVVLEAKGREVAALLGSDWTMRLHENEEIRREGLVYLCGPGGQRISLNVRLYESPVRIEVYGDYATGPDYLGLRGIKSNQRPSITVALDRSAASIAKDIKARFLPEYTALFLEVGRIVFAHQSAWDLKMGVTDRLCAMAGGKRNGPHEWRGADVDGHVYITGESPTVDLKFDNLGEVEAAQLIALRMMLRAGHTSNWYGAQSDVRSEPVTE